MGKYQLDAKKWKGNLPKSSAITLKTIRKRLNEAKRTALEVFKERPVLGIKR